MSRLLFTIVSIFLSTLLLTNVSRFLFTWLLTSVLTSELSISFIINSNFLVRLLLLIYFSNSLSKLLSTISIIPFLTILSKFSCTFLCTIDTIFLFTSLVTVVVICLLTVGSKFLEIESLTLLLTTVSKFLFIDSDIPLLIIDDIFLLIKFSKFLFTDSKTLLLTKFDKFLFISL